MRSLINLTIIFLLSFSYGQAQPPGNPGGGGTPGSVPISGIEYLIGLGGLYGFKKILGSQKNKQK